MNPIPGKLVEGVFKRVLAVDLTPALKEQLATVGIDVSGPMTDSYPRAVWYRAVDLTAQALFPNTPRENQLRRLGVHVINSLQSRHILRGPWLSMARLMGPRRVLKQAMDFLDRSPVKLTIKELSKREFEVSADDAEQPEFLAGLLEAAIEVLGGSQPKVLVQRISDGVSIFRASWR